VLILSSNKMAEMASSVNGVYGSQYAQPAELAASMPSGASHNASGSQSTTTSAGVSKTVEAQEIGWYFVEQYYTTLSKSPERIHLFYNKKSQLVTGVEAEKVLPVIGAKVREVLSQPVIILTVFQAISEKIKDLDIQDCKVRVLNVDSQASFNNIVVQVIGEMSNQNQPHHKFVQTFVLAEQPNGYFVLNDIFRYLNEGEDEIVDDEQRAQPEIPVEEPPAPIEPAAEEPPVSESVMTEEATEQVDEELEEIKEAEKDVTPEPSADADAGTETDAVPTSSAVSEHEKDMTEETEAAEETTEEVTPEAAAPQPTPPKALTPVPDAPPAKKTWASMVGGKAPTMPAVPSQPASVPQAKAPAPRPLQPTQTPKVAPTEPTVTTAATSQGNGWQMADHGKKGKSAPQAKALEGNVLAYIKNVNEKVDARTLREVLEGYGELKYFDVSRPRVSFPS
jgi:Nuclear transport factor 2 (NTF2) domain